MEHGKDRDKRKKGERERNSVSADFGEKAKKEKKTTHIERKQNNVRVRASE